MTERTEPLTGPSNYFEDFSVGDRFRHARGTTIGELENQLLTKLVMNTAQAHFNEHAMKDTPWSQRLVFGRIQSLATKASQQASASPRCASRKPRSARSPRRCPRIEARVSEFGRAMISNLKIPPRSMGASAGLRAGRPGEPGQL